MREINKTGGGLLLNWEKERDGMFYAGALFGLMALMALILYSIGLEKVQEGSIPAIKILFISFAGMTLLCFSIGGALGLWLKLRD